jgi:hypothetical protein
MYLIKLAISLLLVGLFFYSKLLPHSGQLNPVYTRYFSFLKRIFDPICSFLSNKVGARLTIGNNGLKMDASQLVLFGILLLIYSLL